MARRTTRITNLWLMDESLESLISEPDSAAVTTGSSNNHIPTNRANFINQSSSKNNPPKNVKRTQSLTNNYADDNFGAPTLKKIQSNLQGNLEKLGFRNRAEHRTSGLSKQLIHQNKKAFSSFHRTRQTIHTLSLDISREKMAEKDSELVELFAGNSISEQSITDLDEKKEVEIALMIAKKMEQENEDLQMALELSQIFAMDDDTLHQNEKNYIELTNDLQLSDPPIKAVQFQHFSNDSLLTMDRELETTPSLSDFSTEDMELELAIRLSKSSHQPSELELEEKRQLELALMKSLHQH